MSLIKVFSRLSLEYLPKSRRALHTGGIPLFIKFTPALYAEPLKKKKKLDPAIIKQREERRKKKLEKQIRRLEKNARQLKPIDEIEVSLELIDEKEKRSRKLKPITSDVVEQRITLQKKWARYKLDQKISDFQAIDRLLIAQQKALDELRKESEQLYQEAIQPDLSLLPFKSVGPTATPPLNKYESPDGEYLNVTKKYD